MTSLLTDVHITDGTMYNVMQVPDTLYKYGTSRYVELFKKYHTDSVQFRKSFKYYTANPDKLQVIYTQVTANLKQKTDSLNKLNQQNITRDNKRRTDSMKNLPKKPLAKPLIPITPAKPRFQLRPHLPFKSLRRNAIPN